MAEISVIIPNYNGEKYLRGCLDSLKCQTFRDFEVIVVDNGSSDGSVEIISGEYPDVRLIKLKKNTGFCHAVNVGIRASKSPFVMLLNNDTKSDRDAIKNLYGAIRSDDKIFSCCAKLICLHDRSKIDDAGNFYSVLGWALARGKGEPSGRYMKRQRVFACCGAASIYRREVLDGIGLFDEVHFAYLEDIDIGWRAMIYGYRNIYIPSAVVYHAGSGTTGSRYNKFKVQISARNNLLTVYKNLPAAFIVLNFPFLLLGAVGKCVFFVNKGYAKDYIKGLKEGLKTVRLGKVSKVPLAPGNIGNFVFIEMQLVVNVIKHL